MNIVITLVGSRGRFSPHVTFPGGSRVPHDTRVAVNTAAEALCGVLNSLPGAPDSGVAETQAPSAANPAVRTVEVVGAPAQVVVEGGRPKIVGRQPGDTGFGVTSPGAAPAPPPLAHVPSVGMLDPNAPRKQPPAPPHGAKQSAKATDAGSTPSAEGTKAPGAGGKAPDAGGKAPDAGGKAPSAEGTKAPGAGGKAPDAGGEPQ